jgi:hypothetical protein
MLRAAATPAVARQLAASAVAVILPSSGSSNATGQITLTTALPVQPTGTVGVFLPAGVVTAGTQGAGAGVYQATFSSTTVCQLTGSVTTANAAYTQVVTEAVLATTTLPGGVMGLNGAIESRPVWTVNNSVNNKTPRIRFGGAAGTIYSGPTLTSVNIYSDSRRIRNRNSAALQVGNSTAANANPWSTATAAVTVSAVDTTAAVDLVYSGQLAVATDFIILESRETWLLP